MQRYNSVALMAILLTPLAACSTGERTVSRSLSDQEVYQYNLDKPLREKIYCYERTRTGSRIPRRTCMTVADYMDELDRDAATLSVAQPVTDRTFDPFRRGR